VLRPGNRVLVVDEESRLRLRSVEVKRLQGAEVILSSGLEEGERVCASPLDVVVDGMRVRVEDRGTRSLGSEE
jgi:multidrug efflux pump subunit AcrA (membrane-fusion protein)